VQEASAYHNKRQRDDEYHHGRPQQQQSSSSAGGWMSSLSPATVDIMNETQAASSRGFGDSYSTAFVSQQNQVRQRPPPASELDQILSSVR
jgi:hypothetical protein